MSLVAMPITFVTLNNECGKGNIAGAETGMPAAPLLCCLVWNAGESYEISAAMGFLGLLLMISSGKLLADPAFSAVYKMPADIEWADSLCPWKSATETGYLRLVRSRDDDRHRLLVQWIRKSMNEQPDEAVSTRVIDELDQLYRVRLQPPQAQLHPDHCELNM